jgi:hypothetical protein
MTIAWRWPTSVKEWIGWRKDSMIFGVPDRKTSPVVDPSTGTRWPTRPSVSTPTAVDTTSVPTSAAGSSGSSGVSTMACSASVRAMARSATKLRGSIVGSASDTRAVVIARLASIQRAVVCTRSNSRALSMATAAADASALAAASSAAVKVGRPLGSVR